MPAEQLVGMETVLDDATAYLRRSYDTPHPRPLLVLGAKGSGKTSLVKSVANRVEGDRDILACTLS